MMNQEKRTSLKDIAAAAKVSLSTVSSALNHGPGVSEKRRAEICELASKMGYRVLQSAKLLKMKRIEDIGLIVAEDWKNGFNNYGFFELIGNFMKTCQMRKINTQLEWFGSYSSHTPPALFFNGLAGGLLFAGKGNSYVEKFLADQETLPLVRLLEEGKYSVQFDIYDGMLRTMQYLAALGHRRIALVNGSRKFEMFLQAERAYRQSVSDYILDGDERLSMEQDLSRSFASEVERICSRIIEVGADAVVALGGMLSSSLVSQLTIRGFDVPGKISVMAFATLDNETNFTVPCVTSMCVNYPELIETAVQMLRGLMEDGFVPTPRQMIPMDLKVKQTVMHKSRR